MIIVLIIAAILLGLYMETSGIIGADMSTIQSVYDQWNDLASNWADALGNLSNLEILAIITQESRGNPNATNPSDPSYGLMGVTELIGTTYGRINNVSDLYDPATNIKSGATYLSFLKNKYAKSFPLDGKRGWVQMYNEGETHFLNGGTAIAYEQAFESNLKNLQEYEQSLNS